MDEDGNRSITKTEAISFWGNNFAKVNANAMFNEVDGDGNDYVTWEEFVKFWENVKKSGYKEDDICDEVENMLEGGSWVDWNDGRSTDQQASSSSPAGRRRSSISEMIQKIKPSGLPSRGFHVSISRELKSSTKARLKVLFEKMDNDECTVTKEEAIEFWGKNFAKVSATSMFNEVDGNEVSLDKFIEFWQQVKRSGYSDKDILQEVDSMLTGSSLLDRNHGHSTNQAVDGSPGSSSTPTSGRRRSSTLQELKSKIPFFRDDLNRLTKERLKSMFDVIDLDGSGDLTKDEAAKFWSQGFGKVNAMAMFNEVDEDGSGTITYDEFMDFWKNVKRSGYSDKEILSEVESMMEGGSWVDWNDFRSTGS